MTNWLIDRLRPSHKKQPRWVELAEALQTFWSDLFDLQFNVLANMRSIYTADEASQLRKIGEYGWYYEQNMPAISRPIFFGMRKLEMLQKETDIPMMASIQRLGITGCWWEPLYALDNEVYGTRFLHSLDIDHIKPSPANMYMTSRGALMINYYHLNNQNLLPALEQLVRNIKPLHIIFEKTVGVLDPGGPLNGTYFGLATVGGECISIYPFAQTEVESHGTPFYMGACTQIHEKIIIYPK